MDRNNKGRNGGDRPTPDTRNNASNHTASDLHRVGGVYSVRFRLSARGVECTWHPAMPASPEQWAKVDMDRYRAALAGFAASVAATAGGAA